MKQISLNHEERLGSFPTFDKGGSGVWTFAPPPLAGGGWGGGSHFKHSCVITCRTSSLKLTVSQMTSEYVFNISCVISEVYRIFLKAMTWFHGAFPHPLTPSRKTLCLKRGGM